MIPDKLKIVSSFINFPFVLLEICVFVLNVCIMILCSSAFKSIFTTLSNIDIYFQGDLVA